MSSWSAADAVALGVSPSAGLDALAQRAAALVAEGPPDLDHVLELARDLGEELPVPGAGDTLTLWESIATLGAVDLTVARVVEPHLDALAILREAPGAAVAPPGSVWGVFAAEGGPRLNATRCDGEWQLTGAKPWCSLADRVTHALLTAWVDDERRRLFAVDLRASGVSVRQDSGAWAARGLAQVRSVGLELAEVPARPVGAPGWYLERPGFAWGGIGVAVVWFGGAVAVARRVRAASLTRDPDQIALAHLGAIDVALTRARAVLLDAVGVVDGPGVTPDVAGRLALRVRHTVADCAEEVLTRAGHALGPGPLAHEEAHARRVADLALYVRQHHAERDAAALGRALLTEPFEGEWSWW